MLIFPTTTDKLQLVTDSAATVKVVASYSDLATGTKTLDDSNVQRTAIASAATTDILAAPVANIRRNLVELTISNVDVSLSVNVTPRVNANGTAYDLPTWALAPGEMLEYIEGIGWFKVTDVAPIAPAYYGKIAAPIGKGDPDQLMREWQNAGHINTTPTNWTTSIARCAAFRLPFDLTVNTIRFYGVGAVTGAYSLAIYRYSDLARLTAQLDFNTALNAFGTAGTSLNLSLLKGVLYFVAVSVRATGTTAGMACFGTTTSATVGQVQSTPGALPGNLSLGAAAQSAFFFQFPVTTGALPNPAATLAQPAVWTGGFPVLFLDNA